MLDLALRPATLDDAPLAADLATARDPGSPTDPLLQRHEWEVDATIGTTLRFTVLREGSSVGLADMQHQPWDDLPERYATVSADLHEELRTPERLDALLARMEQLGRDDGALRFDAWAWEWDQLLLGVLRGRGYRDERRERYWELDLSARRREIENLTRESRARMQASGVRLATFDTVAGADRWTRLWRVVNEAERDVPTTVPWVPTPFETFTAWMRSPGLREDRIWVALRGEEILGTSLLAYPPERGVVMTDWTGTARGARGLGIARALKCETVTQAIALGVDRVQTDNDSENAPILHLNELMGYRVRAEMVQLIRG